MDFCVDKMDRNENNVYVYNVLKYRNFVCGKILCPLVAKVLVRKVQTRVKKEGKRGGSQNKDFLTA